MAPTDPSPKNTPENIPPFDSSSSQEETPEAGVSPFALDVDPALDQIGTPLSVPVPQTSRQHRSEINRLVQERKDLISEYLELFGGGHHLKSRIQAIDAELEALLAQQPAQAPRPKRSDDLPSTLGRLAQSFTLMPYRPRHTTAATTKYTARHKK